MKSNISLSASGLTISYHQGVVKGLIRHKIINKNTKYTGTSGGAVTSILTKCNVCPDKQHKLTKDVLSLVNDNKEKNIATVFDRYLHENLPDNAAELCNMNVSCAMFKLAWPIPHGYMLNTYENKQDVIDATISSCYIPFLIGDSLTWKFRGQRHVDGGFKRGNILIKVPDSIHIASMPYSQVQHYEFDNFTDIYMGLNGTLPFDEHVINDSSYAIHEDPEYFCNSLFTLGTLDAEAFVASMDCLDTKNKIEQDV